VLADAVELTGLAAKYAELATLRRERALGHEVPPKRVFRELAARFPGALWELDRLPLEEIERRGELLLAASAGGTRAPWMDWLDAYHALFRGALAVKARLRARKVLAAGEASELAAVASRAARLPLDAHFVEAVARPPAGRLAAVVWGVMEARFGESSEAMRGALFPGRVERTALPLGPGDAIVRAWTRG
jgi:hypothetical protein